MITESAVRSFFITVVVGPFLPYSTVLFGRIMARKAMLTYPLSGSLGSAGPSWEWWRAGCVQDGHTSLCWEANSIGEKEIDKKQSVLIFLVAHSNVIPFHLSSGCLVNFPNGVLTFRFANNPALSKWKGRAFDIKDARKVEQQLCQLYNTSELFMMI